MKSKRQQYLAALTAINELAREPKKHRKQLEKLVIEKTVIQTPPFTCVVLKSIIGGRNFWSEGYARQNPIDAWNPEVGRSIAYNRALNSLIHDIDNAIIEHWFELPLQWE